MKRIVLCALALLLYGIHLSAQNVFDPSDPIVRYDKKQPYGSRQNPDTLKPGLQKWVSTPVIGVSLGTDTFDNTSFKQYFINYNGGKVAFRLKFPNSYRKADSASKKYPIMLFLHGGGEVGCPTNGGIYNNERPIWLGGKLFRDRVDKNQFDGFLLYPQYVVYQGCFEGWGTAPTAVYTSILAMIDSMVKYVRADNDRLLIDGLSGGGYGAWRMVAAYPQRVAKIMPSSAAGSTIERDKFVHIPIWFATGGLDPDPSPVQAQYALDRMKEIGADIRYTVFPTYGHNCWYQHWQHPDFVAAMNDVHKANPLCFFQHNEFCNPEDVNAKLGLTPGFYSYEWSRDGQTIATSVNGVNNILIPASVISFTGNEISVKDFGTYRARFKRVANGAWSEWSPHPVVVKSKTGTRTAPIAINGLHSKVLPATDGSTTVPLTMPDGFLNYKWYRVSDNSLLDTNQVFQAPVGQYRARYDEQFGCGSDYSPVFTVIDANGEPKPSPAINLQVVPLSKNVVRLDWSQNAGATDEGSGFEIYRSSVSGTSYQFIKLVAGGVHTARDSSLMENTLYYYLVRAVNGTGAATTSNEAPVKTIGDNAAPTAPSALRFIIKSISSAQLSWNTSTDNDAIERYDIFMDGVKLYSTSTLQFLVTDLDSSKFYNFVVKAVDSAGNVSPASNQITVNTNGLRSSYIPGIPDHVAATSDAYNKIALTWSDTLVNETGFEIVRSTSVNGTYVPVGTVPANGTNFTDSGLTASKLYYYKVRAISATGESAFSDKVSATTMAAPSTPFAPSKLSAQPAGNYVSLTWVDNSTDEQGFLLYRSSDNSTFTQLVALPPNSNAYTDSASVAGEYYYYVVGQNSSGPGEHSNTAQINIGDQPPVVSGLTNVFVRNGESVVENFTATDDPGETVTLTVPDKPSFISLGRTASGYRMTIAPNVDNIGIHHLTIVATNNNGKSTSVTITITVGNKNARSVYINLGSEGKIASSPWNNWLGTLKEGDVLTGIKDENNASTTFSVTAVNAWSGTTNMGHITGDNTGVFPDEVLQSGLLDNGSAKQIKISGLNASMQYNIVFAGSQNEGIVATSSYTTGSQASTLDARYNTNQTANLNNLVPDANGEILITISRTGATPVTYLNGMVIEEYASSVSMLNPANLFAEVVNRTTVKLSWSDRTNNENSTDGYELLRATDSLFTKDVVSISLPANSNAYTNTSLLPDTRYWYTVRAKNSSGYSEYSNRANVITPASMVYVNFNTAVADAPSPWNNLSTPPLSKFTTDLLYNQSGAKTNISLSLTKEFNGEFTAGVNTGNNSGVVPDNALRSDYWLDRGQKSQFTVIGLNHTKHYRFGFFGSSSPPDWFKDNYTATYSINNRTVYLNSWENSTKIVYLGNVTPDASGKVMLDFSTTPEAGYGFNGGVIIMEYTDSLAGGPSVDTIPTIPIDTLPGGNNPPPIDTIPGGDGNPPIDSIPGGDGNPPIDSIPGGGISNPPGDTTISEPVGMKVFPNPLTNQFKVNFNNHAGAKTISVEVYDATGVLTFRQQYGQLPAGNNILTLTATEAHMRNGLYLVVLKIDGKIVQTVKAVKLRS